MPTLESGVRPRTFTTCTSDGWEDVHLGERKVEGIEYKSVDCRLSDHRPVLGTFDVKCIEIDAGKFNKNMSELISELGMPGDAEEKDSSVPLHISIDDIVWPTDQAEYQHSRLCADVEVVCKELQDRSKPFRSVKM